MAGTMTHSVFTRALCIGLSVSAVGWSATRLSAQSAILGPDTVSFSSGTLTLHGVIYRPSGTGRFPVILFNHGSGKNYTRELAAVGPAYAGHGFVFFAPSRRGQWLSSATGQYVIDSLDAIEKSQGLDARNALLVTLMKGPQLDDVRAALAFIKSQPYVLGDRVVVAGNSYGGIVTMYAAAYLDGLWAAVNFAGAAQSWADSPPLQAALTDVAKVARIPVFFGQAENDYDLTPSKVLSATMTKAKKPNVMKIFPPFGKTTPEGHSFGYFGGDTWGPDVVAFVKNPPRK